METHKEAVENRADQNVIVATEVVVTNEDANANAELTNSNHEDGSDLVERILVSPDCQTGWKDGYIERLVDEKLKAVELKMKNIQINRRWGSFTSCVVLIEPVTRKQIEKIDFSAQLKNWKLEIM